MIGIILASGEGKRLRPLTEDLPKPLIKIKNKTIIERQIDSFKKCNIKELIVTTGPFEDKLIYYLKNKYKDINITFIFNPQFDTTNYIYSLWLTKDFINDDIILIHGDLVFDEKLLNNLVKKDNNFVLVNKKAKIPEKDFKATIEDEKVKKIGVDLFSKNSFLSMPMYKFSKDDFLIWMDKIESKIKSGNLNIYAEDAFNEISDEIILKPLYFDKELCMEIDTVEDLEKAKKILE